jgi:type VI protein secretion system component VasK
VSTVNKKLANKWGALLKPFRVLWNQMLGLLFLLFAALMLPYMWSAWQELPTKPDALGRLAIGGLFFLVMLFFGISSYWRARKLERT